ncbi:Nucleoporin autopeptidase [Histomonas meleagridis]|uniref:Nucleoporin autopeptidase n=1 Tax=Histomonas meleagridis TaxID=135588 RepID=UPI003559E974|nr:Nucleoporin autopeptidase [Histomonas meleagridis]KAH0801537.1 Nucleoporin autopeptidase [Histomonas meleagridis]
MFGSTSGFGTSNTGGFGTSNTGGFGTSNTGGFGTSNTGGFGTSSTGAFGTSNTGGFGTSNTGGFGTSNIGGFGTSNTGGFGTNKGAFGSQQKTSWGSFTGTQTKTQNASVIQDDDLFKRIWKLLNSYTKDSPSYKFCFIFYNKAGQNYPTCPENIMQQDWTNICREAPDPEHLAPHPVYGFTELHNRYETQKAIGDALTERMKLVQTKLREMSSFYSTELQGSFEKLRQNSNTINQLLMEVVEMEDVLHQYPELNQTEEEMNQLLKKRQMDEPRLKSKIEDLKNKAKRANQSRNVNHMSIDKNSLSSITKILECNFKALNTLETATKKLEKQVAAIQTTLADSPSK